MLTVTYDELEAALAAADAPAGAAEAHGALCGALAAVAGFAAADWLDELLPQAGASAERLRSRNLLETVFGETAEALAGEDMDFEPILPADEEPLEQRVAALAEWCAAFLAGLGTGDLPPPAELPTEMTDVLRDFGEISRAAVDGTETPESNEVSYAELVEYVRVGVQLTYEELAPHRESRLRA
jgi:uncharacterized protein YgfB (UPF0149 family)